MGKTGAAIVLLGCVVLTGAGRCDAESRTVSWGAVTAYTDGTPIEPAKTVTYDFFWTTDPGLGSASLRTIVSSATLTTATFDPDAAGMPRGQTVYFTGDAVLSTGERSVLSPPYSWTVPVVSPPPAATLSGLSIAGPASVSEGGSGTYTATASWSDGSTTAVIPAWSVSSAYASISASGLLTALSVTSNQPVTVSASYTTGGVTRTANQAVTIVDVQEISLPAPANLELNGPVSTYPVRLFRLKWDPVMTRADGTPVPEGSVSYDAYWTFDSALAEANLTSLATSSATTAVDFDPEVAGMPKNRRVYFTTKAKNASGERSPLSPAVSWVASNQGPSAPKGGKVSKK